MSDRHHENTQNGHISHYVAVKEDITALKKAEQRIIHMANHDVLTGLPTRRLAMDCLVSSLEKAKRKQTKMAILFIDLDGFKTVNDTLGHEAGDHVLIETATRLSTSLREGDTVARVGGDEFWIILTNISDRKCIITAAEKLLKTVATAYQYENNEINIGVSIGIALYPEHGKDPHALVNLADQAMYKIKHQGKNNYAFSETMKTAEVSNTSDLSV
ncbi:GGDEF domain-containing protein [Psychromonas sp. Urea-02u-13]|uniref:GGDEF domain-containing protein n=1 Tax=Psychromonas sp. Urea-02u-13 TaxID=2058326 RepID=UPI000C348961|nr:GGDEF domain-containing protein [Psychromonas sp. Urea-02u-13]PKG38066.1 hypothetical protein CXF74_15735 [Psychromonas sp. Urea-02u-13]